MPERAIRAAKLQGQRTQHTMNQEWQGWGSCGQGRGGETATHPCDLPPLTSCRFSMPEVSRTRTIFRLARLVEMAS